jgi:hypothetical protein
MVNIRATLARAVREGVISDEVRVRLERLAKSLFYPDRSYPRLLSLAAEDGLSPVEIEAIRDWLPAGQVNQKRDDAIAMLCLMRDRMAAGLEPKQVSFWFEHTENWDRAMAPAGVLRTDAEESETILPTTVLEELRLEGSYRRVFERALSRYLALGEAARLNLAVTEETLQETGDRFRGERSLHDQGAFEAWLAERDLTLESFSRLTKEVATTKIVERWAEPWAMRRFTEELILTGDFDRIVDRVRDKERTLERLGRQNPGLIDAGLGEEDLLRWYFIERLNRQDVPDVDLFARELGFPDRAVFVHAVLREYWYLEHLRESAAISGQGPLALREA